ncbi:MAG: acyl-CoA/acyl-ACP dehydrogenase [Acidimicrobiales bacterium]|nr:acyl-CoA/acyl-ACP dehydrogenase [Acidimicrobiales bacterium]
MYLRLNADELTVQDMFHSFFETECSVERVRTAQQMGFDAMTWQRLIETGAPGMCVSSDIGGGGASLATGAVVADLLGQFIAPIPLIEHIVATRLIVNINPNHPSVPALLSGQKIATLTLQPPRGNTAELVPAGAVAHTVISLERDRLVIVDGKAPNLSSANTADLPLADRSLTGNTLLAEGKEACAAYDRARSEWQALMAVALTGLARRSVEIGVEYVKERHQFGVLIGSFQSLQHGLATAITNVEGSNFLSNRAVSALEESDNKAPQLASMAFLFAAETAMNAAATSLQYHGGYGFAEEYDIQLYYRRAKGWPLQLGDPSVEYQRLASTCLPVTKGA